MIEFVIEALPIAKPRMSRRDRFEPRDAVMRYFGWADMVQWTAKQHIKEPLTCAVWLTAIFFLPMGQSWSEKRRAKILADDEPHISRPDLKNLVAGLEDSLNGIAWKDDSQIVSHLTFKHYGEQPCCYVNIRTSEETCTWSLGHPHLSVCDTISSEVLPDINGQNLSD